MSLTHCLYKDVFIVCGDEDEGVGELFVTDNWDDLILHLTSFSPSVDSGMRVFNGYVTSAEFLPDSLRGKTAFFVVEDPDDPSRGALAESGATSPEELASDLLFMINNAGLNLFAEPIDVEDVFILYGYQLQTCISVDESDIDDEALESCEEISAEVERTASVVLKDY